MDVLYYFFVSLRADGILQILQSDWFWERAVFTISPAYPGGIVGNYILEAQKCSCKHFLWHFYSEKSILGKCTLLSDTGA